MEKTRSRPKTPRNVQLTPGLVADCLQFGISRFVRASSTVQSLCDQLSPADPRRVVLRKVRETLDEQFAIALRETVMVRHLAKTTDSVELLFDAVSGALYGADDLPELLRLSERFAEPSDLDGSSSDTFYFHFAQAVVGLVKHLEELCTKHPERFRLLARELPYWPMLVFRHKAANNHLFEKSADGQKPLADLLELGSDCPINVSNRANYSLKTPINAFLWTILSELHWGRGWVRSILSKEFRRDSPQQTNVELLSARAEIPIVEAELHFRAFQLPPLDKTTSNRWVDDILMPWVRLKHPDLRGVPAFARVDLGPTGRRYAAARKLLLKALTNLARKTGAGWA